MKFLVNVVETYRIGTEKEATEFIEAAKHCPEFTLVKYSNERKFFQKQGYFKFNKNYSWESKLCN